MLRAMSRRLPGGISRGMSRGLFGLIILELVLGFGRWIVQLLFLVAERVSGGLNRLRWGHGRAEDQLRCQGQDGKDLVWKG